MRQRRMSVVLIVAGACAAGCRPTLDEHPGLIAQSQIVAWKAAPAEAPAGSQVTFQVFALDPSGPVDTTVTSWTMCHARKPLDENRVVPPACLEIATPDAFGDPVQLTIPADACGLFGPDTPQPAPGAPPTRPRDPDGTGGYYQPLTLVLGTSVAVGLQRISCGLPDASLATARAFQAAYAANQNPTITGLGFSVNGVAIDPAFVPAGARITVAATWSADSAERYALFDRATATIVETTETLIGSWFVTGGELELAGVTLGTPTPTSTTTVWQAPWEPATFQVAFVLRDSRGGTDVVSATLVVP